MPIVDIEERSWIHAASLQLGIRATYLAESWGGLKPFLLRSLNGHPETGEAPGPEIDGGTALGVKLLWALTAFARQHPLSAAAFRFSGARFVANRAHERLYRRILQICEDAPPTRQDMPLPEFDWRSRSPAEFEREFVDRPHPVVLRGFASDCEAVKNWSFRSLLERFGDEEVLLTTEKLDGEPGRMREVDSGSVYLHNSEILFRKYPELADALPLGALERFTPLKPTYMQLFLGREGTGTPFHSAANWNWFFNVAGRKTWWFVDPRHGLLTYPISIMGHAAAFALVGYPDDYDSDFFPCFRHCPVFEVTLEPGDVIFNPPWWWHAVRNVSETTVGVASRWMLGGQAGTRLRAVEENYDIDRMRSWLYFAGIAGWPHLHGVLRTPSPTLTPNVTLREKRNRFAHLQRRFASGPVFGMRHRY